MSPTSQIVLRAIANFIVSLANVSIIIYYLTRKNMRAEKTLLTTIFLCICDGAQSTVILASEGYRLMIIATDSVEMNYNSQYCMRYGILPLVLYFLLITGVANFYYSFEKFLMIYRPFWYKHRMCPDFHKLFGATILFCGLIIGGLCYYWYSLPPHSVSSLCITGDVVPVNIEFIILMTSSSLVIIGAVSYVPVTWKIGKLRQRIRSKEAPTSGTICVRCAKSAVIAGLMVLTVVVTMIIPNMLHFILPDFYSKNQEIFQILGSIKPLVNVFVAIHLLKHLAKIHCSPSRSVSERRMTSAMSTSSLSKQKIYPEI